jgi:ribose transport system permease protein
MNKNILGILGLFICIFGFTALSSENFLGAYNQQNLLKWSSLYAIMGIGVAFVIITGGIDLSIGSVIGLVASLMALMVRSEWNPAVAVLVLIALSLGIGLVHGLLVTKMKLQPFVVTLCGLLFYRGISRWATDNQSMGYGDTETLNSIFSGKFILVSTNNLTTMEEWLGFRYGPTKIIEIFGLPAPFFFLVVVAVLAAIFLNRTIWGRYLLALGNNEDGARYSGIETDRLKITAYVICSFLAGLSGLLFAYELDSVQPAQTGEFYELYAIAAAVLGGCSLRGGQGTILGVIIAAAVIRLLRNSINLLGISTHLEYAIIGMVILCGVSADEIIKRVMAKRRGAK